ncbi:MAG: hypothetical protein CMC14_12065 [Flavobacteriaceae bacterium]|nr:hypothetical protein [Flavobacteriaceae bacterium]|tara:strand:- start:96370 stop:97278 length:909 start_codon:yes stop_codon:yes gene_type:complete
MKIRFNLSYCLIVIYFLIIGCHSDDIRELSIPILQTTKITDITETTASSGGLVLSDGGTSIINKGICWDIKSNPSITHSTKTIESQESSLFNSMLSNLVPNQKYYVRAYATNSVGTSYGNEVSFFTNQKNTIIYKKDGRILRLGDPLPLTLDISEDGMVDFTVFVELTANTQGDRLYVGINPIGPNLIKSGPPINENFLNMGLIISEPIGTLINQDLVQGQRWTNDYGALVIRNTSSNGITTYEGSWENSAQIVGIQNNINNSNYFGWIRIEFNKVTEVVTLIDYAFNSTLNHPILSGETNN